MFFHITPKNIALIILSVAFIATFLCIFYFTYVSKVEGQIVSDQMSSITVQLLDEVTVSLPKSYYPTIKSLVGVIKPPNMEAADKVASDSNNKIFQDVIKVIVPVITVAVIGTYMMSKKYEFSYTEILIQALLGTAAAGLTEFTFLKLFISKYMVTDVNFVKYKVLDALDAYVNNNK